MNDLMTVKICNCCLLLGVSHLKICQSSQYSWCMRLDRGGWKMVTLDVNDVGFTFVLAVLTC